MATKKKSKPDEITKIGARLTTLESPAVITKMIQGLSIICVILFLVDFLHLRHGKFSVENILGFYGFYGFAAFAFIIFATKLLKKLLSRDESYYSPDAVDGEDYPVRELGIQEHKND